MKRYISLACVVIVAFMAVAVPVSADEVDFSNVSYINVLDFAPPSTGSNFVDFDGDFRISYDLGFRGGYSYVDILFSCTSSSVSLSVSPYYSSYFTSLSVVSVGSNLYRAFGSIRSNSTYSLHILFNSSALVSLEILGFKAYKSSASVFDEFAFCQINSRDFKDTISYVPTDEINRRVFSTDQTDPSLQWLDLYIWSDNWRKYDYLEYTLEVICSEITSITAYLGDDPLPFEVSWIQSATPSYGTQYLFSVSVDLTGVDRASSAIPTVFVSGKLSVVEGQVNSVDILGCVGAVNSQTINPVVYFLRNIWSTLKSNFTSMVNSLSGWFTSVIDTLKEGFSVSDSDGSGADFSTEASEQGDQFDDITDAMQGLEKPDISGSDIDPGIIVPTADVKFATSPLTVVLSDGVIKDIFMLALIFIFAGYIIYGKR